jgi:4-oxalocrotonate tautomerase
MPVITVKMTKEDGGATKEQKEQLAQKMTKVFADIFGRGASSAVVIIEEVPTDNYAIGGKTISQIRSEQN